MTGDLTINIQFFLIVTLNTNHITFITHIISCLSIAIGSLWVSWGLFEVLKAFIPSGGALLLLSPSWLLCLTILSSSFCLFQDVDMMDQNGMTPLMWAAYRTHRCVYFKFCGRKHKDVCVAPFCGEDVVEMFLVKYWLLRNNLACGAGVHSGDSCFCRTHVHTSVSFVHAWVIIRYY